MTAGHVRPMSSVPAPSASSVPVSLTATVQCPCRDKTCLKNKVFSLPLFCPLCGIAVRSERGAMSRFLQTYTSLSSPYLRQSVTEALQSIIDGFPMTSDPNREELIQRLIDDLQVCARQGGAAGKLTTKDAAQALLAVKTLGKHPTGSKVIATSANLSALLGFVAVFKNDPEISNEALRCVANALLLVDEARVTWVEEVGGGEASIALLEKSTNPERIFLVSRILFLCTASPSSSGVFIQNLVEGRVTSGNIVNIIGSKLDSLTAHILDGANMAGEAMTDLLKVTFNLVVHYPKIVECEPQIIIPPAGESAHKVMGDYWSPKLDGILSPLLRVFTSLPLTPIAAPLTHVVHSLMAIPVTASLRSTWLGNVSDPPSPPFGVSQSSRSSTPVKPPRSSTSSRPSSPSKSAKEPKPGAIDRALSVITVGRRSVSRSPIPSNPDTLLRAYNLLDVSLSHYLPEDIDPDESSVREMCQLEAQSSLDNLMTPLAVLVTRLCIADVGCRNRMQNWLLPVDLDRTSPLEGRSDALGRCLRLLRSVYHTSLKDAVGEMLFAVCGSDAATLCAHVGYGNVAGFLFHKGIVNAPTVSTNTRDLTTPSGEQINPITGTVEEKIEPSDMTDEEKEQEAEKLFVLFDRLEKTGAMPPSQNPIRKAIQEGRLPT